MSRRLAGVDVGGTFTDIAVYDGDTGTVELHKLLSTPADPARAIVDGLRTMGVEPDTVVHATTLVTNALIERRGVDVGLLTTSGYRDVVEVATELRYDPFDLKLTRPDPLAPRHLRVAVEGRIDSDGSEVRALDKDAVQAAARTFVDAGVRAVAVAFFNSYRNPGHELEAAAILRESAPELSVCCSAQIAAEIREYPRFSTALANAYIQPIAEGYLLKLEEILGVPLFVMLSDGGITTARAAAEHPIHLVESGPAAGAMGSAHLASAGGWPNVLAFDMGGTTAKLSLIRGGVPERTHELEVGRVHRFKKGSGLPVRIPVVQLIEIGAGGGSIASVDSLGLLRVGPRSSGAVPGPACYGRGGEDPTVTDADLHLGYLNPDKFLGGRMALDAASSTEAIRRLADRLGMSVTEAAAGIVDVVNNNMATAARIHIAEHGQDPRQFRMVAFGGAGPVHAYGLARALNVREVVFPQGAGVASAVGMLVAPRSMEHTKTLVCGLSDPDWNAVHTTVEELKDKGIALMREADIAPADVKFEISADMRFVGQGYEITVPVSRQIITESDTAALAEAFHAEYRRRFDRNLAGKPAEVISWRVRALSEPSVTSFRFAEQATRAAATAASTRTAYFAEADGFVDVKAYDRALLNAGDVVRGPAVIEETESTVVVGPSAVVTVDPSGNLVMTIHDGQQEER
ncbi:MAG: hydantoinase/oxoprolinase family protein [Micromonosporaceae bacterium]